MSQGRSFFSIGAPGECRLSGYLGNWIYRTGRTTLGVYDEVGGTRSIVRNLDHLLIEPQELPLPCTENMNRKTGEVWLCMLRNAELRMLPRSLAWRSCRGMSYNLQIGFEHHILLHTQHSGVIAIEVPAEILPPPIDQRAFSWNLLQRTDYVWPSSVFFQSCDAASAADEGALELVALASPPPTPSDPGSRQGQPSSSCISASKSYYPQSLSAHLRGAKNIWGYLSTERYPTLIGKRDRLNYSQ